MLIMDMPHIPPQGSPVLRQIADAGQKERTKPGSEPLYTTVGVCVVSPTLAHTPHGTNSSFSDGMPLYPQAGAGYIFPEARDDVELQSFIEAAPVQVIQQPKHGTVEMKDRWNIKYLPNQDYVGNDKIIFLVNVDGRNIKVVYFIKVVDTEITSENFLDITNKYYPKTEWRISSSATEANAIVSLLTQNWPSFAQSNTNTTFTDLPTTNPNEWQARPGSDAARHILQLQSTHHGQ